MLRGSALVCAPAVAASARATISVAAPKIDQIRFMGWLLTKVGLDCVTRGLDVNRGRERHADTASTGKAGEEARLLRDVPCHAREQRPVGRDRHRARCADV